MFKGEPAWQKIAASGSFGLQQPLLDSRETGKWAEIRAGHALKGHGSGLQHQPLVTFFIFFISIIKRLQVN